MQHTATHCNTLQITPTHSNVLQHCTTRCNTFHHFATNCNRRKSAHCNTLHCTAAQYDALQQTATHSNAQQHAATVYIITTHCNALQDTATHLADGRKCERSAVLYCKESSLQCTATHWFYLWHNAPICDMTHSHVTCRSHMRHDSYVIDTLLLQTHTPATRESVMTHSQVWHVSFTCVTRLTAMCVTSHSYVAPEDTHASYKRVCDDSFTIVT